MRPSTLVFAVLLLLLAGPLAAQEVVQSLVADPLVLQGRDVRAEIVVPVQRPASAPSVTLAFDYSALLDPRQSRVTVFVDDRPRRSLRLADLPARLTVPLAAAAGFQRVSLRARLVIDEDPCLLEHPEGAWLTVLPASAVRYRQTPVSAEGVAAQVRAVPDAWREADVETVYLGVPDRDDTQTLRALLDLDHLVRAWGFAPRYDAPTTPGAARLRVTLGAPDTTIRWQRVARHEDVTALAQVSGATLALHATTPAALLRTVALLRDADARALCDRPTCLIGPAFTARLPETAEGRPDGQVLALPDLGFPLGWTAQGAGVSQLRFVWQRPPWWSLQRWPELRLRVRFSGMADWRPDAPGLTVRLNGQPLASYALHDAEDNLTALSVRIPPQFWETDAWVFEVAAHLRENTGTCAWADPEALWLVVEPESGLYVPREEQRFGGLADFFEEHEAPRLQGDSLLARRHLPALAAALYPFRDRRAEIFDWDAGCAEGCFEIVAASAVEQPDVVSLGEMPHGVDREGDLRLPVLSATTLYHLARTDRGIRFALPPRAAAIPVPDYQALRGTWAFHYDDRWVGRGPGEPTEAVQVGTPTPEEDLATSEEAYLSRIIDFVWVLVVLLVLALAAFWIWRGYRTYQRGETDDIEHYG